MTRTIYRFRLAAVCLCLVALAFLQEPGRVAADTKLDLTANPVGFLARALHLWDDSGFFGQVQNQAYGYLWPVGPFFAVLREIGVAAWAAQRLWWAVVLLVGFLGLVRLSRLLGIQSGLARVLAGLGYVLSVRMITEMGAVSAEAWPMAVAPWLLVPLVRGSAGGSPRRWAALSGIAFWMTGAINAVASAAILPLGGLYLVTRRRSRRAWSLLAWWGLSLGLASLWWVVPLVVLGKYSPPFLDWIEAAAITTGQNDPTSVLRGASQWVPYLVDAQGPVWPAGWQLLARPVLVAASALVTLMGIGGLMARRVPERSFLVLVLCSGLVLTGLGHVSASGIGGLGAEQIRILLDGALAPLRNVHKFQPLVTLPLMIGMAHLLERARAWQPAATRIRPWWSPAVALAGAGVVAVAAMPALSGQIVGGRSYLEIPGYWQDAAHWLNFQDDGRALVVPAASFGVYVWGRTQDDPLQALDTRSWAVRDAVPLSSAGNIRLLDEVERRLEAGTGSAGLSAALGRAGVRWLVVRNDLDGRATRSALPVLVHQALDSSPGISLAATFGPILSAFQTGERVVDGGLQRSYPAVEVFQVTADAQTVNGRVALRDASSVVQFTGAAEAMVDLGDSRLIGSSAAFAVGDQIPSPSIRRGLITDHYRRAEVNFGAAQRQYSNTMTDGDPFLSERPVHDYYPVEPAGLLSEARWRGATSVTASSSGSSPFALRGRSTGAQPWAAIDGDSRTAWLSGDFQPGVGQWWQIELPEPHRVSRITVALLGDVRVGRAPASVRLSVKGAVRDFEVTGTSEPQILDLGSEVMTDTLRLELLSVRDGGSGQGFGIAEVDIPGVSVDRPILTAPSSVDAGLAFGARSMGREGCAATASAIVCDPQLPVAGEERAGIDRVVDTRGGGYFRLQMMVRPRPGAALDEYLGAPSNAVRIRASSQLTSDPAVRAQAAADQLTRTTWIASPLDREPTLTVDLPAEQTVTGLILQTAPDAPASRPLEVTVRINGVDRTVFTDPLGKVLLPAVRTDRIMVTFGTVNGVRSVDSATGVSRMLPVGITELVVLGGPDRRMLRPERASIPVPCGLGPSLLLDDREPVLTRVDATVGGVLEGDLAGAAACGDPLVLPAGVHRIRVEPTEEWLVERVFLIPIGTPKLPAAPDRPTVVAWSSVERQVDIPPDLRPRFLETTENFNEGWRARLGDVDLPAYRVDGWRQAFLVPAGLSGQVAMWYAPDGWYRTGLLLGVAASAILLLLAMVRPRGPQPAPTSPAPLRGVAAAAPLATALLVGGIAGAVASGVVFVAAMTASRRGSAPRSAASAVGVVGLAAALAAQVLAPWPGRMSLGRAADLLFVIGPSVALGAMALGALGVAAAASPDDPSAGSDVPAPAS